MADLLRWTLSIGRDDHLRRKCGILRPLMRVLCILNRRWADFSALPDYFQQIQSDLIDWAQPVTSTDKLYMPLLEIPRWLSEMPNEAFASDHLLYPVMKEIVRVALPDAHACLTFLHRQRPSAEFLLLNPLLFVLNVTDRLPVLLALCDQM